MRVPYSNHIVCLSTLSLCCDNSNTFLPRTFNLGQLRKSLIWALSVCSSICLHFLCAVNTFLENFQTFYMGIISQKENTYSFWGHYVKGQGHRQFLWFFFYIPFSNATLTQIRFDPFQTWNMESMSDMGNTYSFWGHFVKGQGHGHFHGQFNDHNSLSI